MLLIRQEIEEKLNFQEKQLYLYTKNPKCLLSEKRLYIVFFKNSECVLGIGNRLIIS